MTGARHRLFAFSMLQRASERTEIPQPQQWVPFSAELVITFPGRPSHSGRVFRASDGSVRLESGPARDNTVRVISIQNVTRGVFYLNGPRGENRWTESPLQTPTRGWRPLRRLSGTEGLTRYPYKVALGAGMDGSLQASDGFDAYQYIGPSRASMALQLPALNFYDVVRQSFVSGRREVLSNIVIGEPDGTLFEPPPGAPLVRAEAPAGIVRRSQADRRARLGEPEATVAGPGTSSTSECPAVQ
jgi:hypothetical protein